MRKATIERMTNETKISLSLDLDGSGIAEIDTGCGFLNHMLQLFAFHGGFDLKVACKGDVEVDYHHTVEDIGIALGSAFLQALGDKKGIARYGYFILPMDEALILSSVDIGGRCYLGYDLQIPTAKVGDFDTELVKEFWWGFSRNAACNLHIRQLAGENSHHIIEGAFKSVARSISAAVKIVNDTLPSTKGAL